MSSQEFVIENPGAGKAQRRVVEAEIRLPHLGDLQLPKVDMEPVRATAEQILLTGIGVAVLVARGLTKAVNAAHQAGMDAAEKPGPVTRALLGLVRKQQTPATESTELRVKVPVLPIDDYAGLTPIDVLERLPELSPEQLRVLREYEVDHMKRTTVLKAIDRQLATD